MDGRHTTIQANKNTRTDFPAAQILHSQELTARKQEDHPQNEEKQANRKEDEETGETVTAITTRKQTLEATTGRSIG